MANAIIDNGGAYLASVSPLFCVLTMTLPGKEIYRTFDEFGPIQVFDDGNKRYLAFGSGDEQSCIFPSQPSLLLHDYTRAMMLVLLFHTPTKVTFLGLGGGSMVSCIHRHFPESEINIVELRQGVVDTARRYFDLPRDERVTVSVKDAGVYLKKAKRGSSDLIFCDLYGPDGIDMQQLQPAFIERCHDQLADDGWLVLNCWQNHRSEAEGVRSIMDWFPETKVCSVPGGNWTIIAGKKSSSLSQKKLEEKAKALSARLGFSLSAQLKRMEDLGF